MGRHTALKVKRSVILLLFAIVASATLSARHNRESNTQGYATQLLLAAAERAAFERSPTTPDAASRHLLQAITWAGNGADRKVLYLTAERFMYGVLVRLSTPSMVSRSSRANIAGSAGLGLVTGGRIAAERTLSSRRVMVVSSACHLASTCSL
jgi:hypothetical protein